MKANIRKTGIFALYRVMGKKRRRCFRCLSNVRGAGHALCGLDAAVGEIFFTVIIEINNMICRITLITDICN